MPRCLSKLKRGRRRGVHHGRQRGGTDAAAGQEDALVATAGAHPLDLSTIPPSSHPDLIRPLNARRKYKSTLIAGNVATVFWTRAIWRSVKRRPKNEVD